MQEYISAIPEILTYFVPGMCVLTFFRSLTHKRDRRESSIVWAIILSYLLVAGVEFFFGNAWPWHYVALVASISGIIIAVIAGLLIVRTPIDKLLINVFHISWQDSVMDEVVKKGDDVSYLIVHLEDEDEILKGYYAYSDDDYLALRLYKIVGENEEIKTDTEKIWDTDSVIMIPFSKIKYYEVWNF